MPDPAALATAVEEDNDPFATKLFIQDEPSQAVIEQPIPAAPATPEAPAAPAAPETPAAPATPATSTTKTDPGTAVDDRPRGPDGKFLPKEASPEKETPAAPTAPRENLLGKLSSGEIEEMPTKSSAVNPGKRPAEDTEEYETWKEQRAALVQARREAEELRTRLKETEGKIPADYEEIRKRAEAAEAREAARDVRMRPEFQEEIAIPIQNIGAQIENAIKDRGFNKGTIGEIINIEDDVERDTRLHEYLSGGEKPLPTATIARLGIQIERLRQLRAEGDELLKNAPQVMENLKAQDDEKKAKEAEQEKALYEKGKGLVFQVFESEFADLMKNDKSRQEVEKAAARNWNDLKPAQRALALSAPAMLQELQASMEAKVADYETRLADSAKEVASLRLQLQRIGGAGPTVEPHTAPTQQEDPNADPFRAKLMGN